MRMGVLMELQWLLLFLSTGAGTVQLPPHFCLDVDVVYNRGFKAYLELRGESADNAARILVQQANRFFHCDSLAKETQITVRVRNVSYNSSVAALKWRATSDSLRDARKSMTNEQRNNADHVAFLTHDRHRNDKSFGYAFSADEQWSAICYRNVPFTINKSSMTEVQATSMRTAQVLAHEIAHTLAIPEDYTGKCSGSGSIMDHLKLSGSDHWSQCSLDQLRGTYKKGGLRCIAQDCSDHYKPPTKIGCPTERELAKSNLQTIYFPFLSFNWNTEE